jgi:predicted nucleic acid-binding protein
MAEDGGPASEAPAPVVVDASVWVSFFVTTDSTHAASVTWLERHTAAGGMVVAPSILLIEVAAAISRRLGPAGGGPAMALAAVSAIGRLPLTRIVPMDPDLVEEATELAAGHGLRGADAIYVATARRLAIRLLTWDADQLARAPSTVHAFRP